MKLFRIFDRWGNKVGEVHEAAPAMDGLGGFLGGFALFVICGSAATIWPVCIMQLTAPYTTTMEMICGAVQLMLEVVVLLISACLVYTDEVFSFAKTLGKMTAYGTLIPGIITYLLTGLLEGNMGFSMLLMSLYVCFLLALSAGVILTFVVMLARWIKFRVKE